MKIVLLSKRIGTTLTGRDSALKLKNEMLALDHPVQLDFSGVKTMSYPFAETFFGRLANDHGPEIFASRIRIKNMQPRCRAMVDLILKKAA